MSDRRLAKSAARLARGFEDREFALRLRAVGRSPHAKRARVGQDGQQPLLLLRLGQRGIVRLEPRLPDQFGDGGFVPVRILAEVGGRQMEAENLDGPDQRPEADRHERFAVPLSEGLVHDAEVRKQLLRRSIGFTGDSPDPGLLTGERPQRLRDARMDADDGAPVGLVVAMRVGVARAGGERFESIARSDQDA